MLRSSAVQEKKRIIYFHLICHKIRMGSNKEKHTKWQKYEHCKTAANYEIYKKARNLIISELRKREYLYEKDVTLLYVHCSIAIILMGKRELVAFLNLSFVVSRGG